MEIKKIEYECISDKCNWKGEKAKCSILKHDPTYLLCPECHEHVEETRPAQRGRRKALRKRAAHAYNSCILDHGSSDINMRCNNIFCVENYHAANGCFCAGRDINICKVRLKYEAAQNTIEGMAAQQATAKGQNLPLDCIGIKSDSESGKTSAI